MDMFAFCLEFVLRAEIFVMNRRGHLWLIIEGLLEFYFACFLVIVWLSRFAEWWPRRHAAIFDP
ncbi:MAG: hypothetical protein CL912_17645 [Deltaproteobacteria bacterium]|nr:hypothetical protein [Deltaproteobacteria bacterium]